jgi:methionine synthase II (cobalamin-independent)
VVDIKSTIVETPELIAKRLEYAVEVVVQTGFVTFTPIAVAGC